MILSDLPKGVSIASKAIVPTTITDIIDGLVNGGKPIVFVPKHGTLGKFVLTG